MSVRIMLGVNDIEKSKQFYDAVLTALGYDPGVVDPKGRPYYSFGSDSGLSLSLPMNDQPATPSNGTMISLSAKCREHADAWYAAGIANGGSPGAFQARERNAPFGRAYSTYLHDPDGHSLSCSCVVD